MNKPPKKKEKGQQVLCGPN